MTDLAEDAGAIEARICGRPRSAEADEAILRAALELCAQDGFDGATVEAVAARAGVGKATVYRRYPNRVGLAVAAATHVCSRLVDDVDTGSVREDLRLIAHSVVRMIDVELTRVILAEIAATAARNAEVREAQQQFVATRRAVTARAIARGIARGELRPDTDRDVLGDFVIAGIFHRGVTLGEPVDDRYADRLVDAAMGAFGVVPDVDPVVEQAGSGRVVERELDRALR